MSRPGQYKTGDGFQFLGIPPKGEPVVETIDGVEIYAFPISRDPPEGGTTHIRCHN